MAKRTYLINEEHLHEYVKANYAGSIQVLGETEDAYIVGRGSKISQLAKSAIESWSLDNGHIQGIGLDAMDPRLRAIAEGNRANDTSHTAERRMREATSTDAHMEAYHNQLPSTRLMRAMTEESEREFRQEDINARGNMKYATKPTYSDNR